MPKLRESLEKLYDKCKSIVDDRDRKERMEDMKKENLFYQNAQWEGDESDDLEATGQVDVVLNTMRRSFRTLLSLIVTSSPTAKFMPNDAIPSSMEETEEFKNITETLGSLQGLWNHCWYISGQTVVMRRAAQDMLVMGLGYIRPYLDKESDYYRGEVKFTTRRPWEMAVPLNATEMDFSDARYMFYRKIIPMQEAFDLVDDPDLRDEIRKSSSYLDSDQDYDVKMLLPDQREIKGSAIGRTGMGATGDDGDRVVEWIETEQKIKRDARLFKVIYPGNVIHTYLFVPDQEKDLSQFDLEGDLRNKGIQGFSVEFTDIKVDRVKCTKQVGKTVEIEEEWLPTSSFTNIPFIDEDTYNPLSLGEAHFVKSAQKLLNKVFSLAVLHLQTSGSGDKLVGVKGAFGDTPQAVEDFQNHYAHPISATEIGMEIPETGGSVNDLIKNIPATPLQPAAVQILQILTGSLDRMMGVNPQSWGDSSGAPRTLGATLSIKEWGDENARIPLIHIQYALQKLGNVWLDLALNHYTYPKPVSSTDHNGLTQQYQFNWPDNEGNVYNSLDGIKASIFVASGSSLMVNRYSMLMIFKELMPLHPVFTKMFLLYSDIPDKFDIIQEVDQVNQMEQSLQQLMPQLQQLQQLAESKDKDIQSLKKKVDLTRMNATLKQIETKYRERMKYLAKMQEKRGGER